MKELTKAEEQVMQVIWKIGSGFANEIMAAYPEPKPAYNTVEEYNQQTSYGQDRGGFNAEGELPEEEDSVYVRRSQLVKYLGVTKSVTHQMTLVNTMVGSVMERTIKDGTMWILRTLNQGLYFGNEKIVPEQFN
ncbi:MAG: BlaI/MecI/CopY family transcriptional regulator, partial [Bacteroidales bacterium]|nr:BlaI/MecI/CopY family transcriptional regulator [Bacteroidales bacterium]